MDMLSYILGKKAGGGGGGGSSVLIDKSVSANGVYNASSDDADGYKKVTVDVPNTYAAGDEGKVVSNGALVAQTAHSDVTPTTSDQTIDTTTNNSLKVKGDAGLVAANIKKDVEIFGVTGSYEGGGGGVLLDKVASGIYEDDDEIELDITSLGRTFANTQGAFILSLPNLTTLRTSFGFEYCTAKSVSMPNFNDQIKGFTNSTTKKLFAPKAMIAQSGMQNSAQLETVVASSGVNWTQYNGCGSLKAVDYTYEGNTGGSIDNSWQTGCTTFDTLILRKSSVVTLANLTAFNSTKFASSGAGGTLYVPSSLISSYQAASNWSIILGYANNQIKAIEGSYYETHYADGTLIPT